MATEELIHSFGSVAEVREKFVAVPSLSCTRDSVRCHFLTTTICTLRINDRARGPVVPWSRGPVVDKCPAVMYLTKENAEKHALQIITWRLKS